jgi:hypothetical protein
MSVVHDNWVEEDFLPKHPMAKTLHHQVRLQQNWKVCATIDRPKRMQNAIPAPFVGTYPYDGSKSSFSAVHP